MNATAKMCIEHIVIGLQTTWIIIYIFICNDNTVLAYMKELNTLTHVLIVLPVAYALGIAIDRVAKKYVGLFYETYLRIKKEYIADLKHEDSRKRHVCKKEGYCKKIDGVATADCRDCGMMKISKLVWKYHNEMDYFDDLFSRVRIVRGSCLNSVLLLLAIFFTNRLGLSPNVIKSNFLLLIIFVLLMVIMFHYTEYKLLSQYYHKERKYTYVMFLEEEKARTEEREKIKKSILQSIY